MNDRALLSARVADCNARSPNCPPVSDECNLSSCPENAIPDDRFSLRLSDESREDAIRRGGVALARAMGRVEAANRRYQASSCLLDKADMDAASLDVRKVVLMLEKLIHGASNTLLQRLIGRR